MPMHRSLSEFVVDPQAAGVDQSFKNGARRMTRCATSQGVGLRRGSKIIKNAPRKPVNIFNDHTLIQKDCSGPHEPIKFSLTKRGLKPDLKKLAQMNTTPVTINPWTSHVTNKIYTYIPSKYNDK